MMVRIDNSIQIISPVMLSSSIFAFVLSTKSGTSPSGSCVNTIAFEVCWLCLDHQISLMLGCLCSLIAEIPQFLFSNYFGRMTKTLLGFCLIGCNFLFKVFFLLPEHSFQIVSNRGILNPEIGSDYLVACVKPFAL